MFANLLTCSARAFIKAPRAVTPSALAWRAASSNSNPDISNEPKSDAVDTSQKPVLKPQPEEMAKDRKTMAELDEELRQKMSGLSGDGGESGIEYEDGVPVSMKRSVKENMFRYI